jgi:hypothetical protein
MLWTETPILGLRPDEQGLHSRICDCAPEINRERVIRRARGKDLSDRLWFSFYCRGDAPSRTILVSTRS